jgi:hypothetical protein
MGISINILPVLYDEGTPTKFSPIKDFKEREWLEGNNYWFKEFEKLTGITLNYSETDTTLLILYNGQLEPIITEGNYFKEIKRKIDIGVYKKVILYQNEVNWDTFERLLDIEDFFYDIFKNDKRFLFVRNIFKSRFNFTKINSEFTFGCFPFQILHNFNETNNINWNVEKKHYLFSANCNVKEERLHFYEFLEKGNYWDKCNVSFFLPLMGIQTKRFVPSEYIGNLGKLDLDIQYLPKKLKYDDELNVKKLPIKDSLECLFQMIFETRYHSHCGIVLSEKLFKGFMYRTPFIVYGQHGVLKLLKEKGFKTFDWLIDESYDWEIDDIKRLEMVLKEIDRLLNTPFETIERLISQHQQDLVHNRYWAEEFAKTEINKLKEIITK